MCRNEHHNPGEQHLQFSKTISSTKFPILLAKSSADSSEYVVKTFADDSFSKSCYLREKRVLSSVCHPNIIHYVPSKQFNLDLSNHYILIEYAPYGDFFNFLTQKQFSDEKLVRTFFHHIIEGLECLHSKGIAHLDIKLENLLLGTDCLLKIADFDVAQKMTDKTLVSSGTENYRAPEIMNGTCKDYGAADIYSVGICLFALFSKAFPFLEEFDPSGIQSYKKFIENKKDFWIGMEQLLGKKIRFTKGLKLLLDGLLAKDPQLRFTIKQIKDSEWYQEPIYSQEELKKIVDGLFNK